MCTKYSVKKISMKEKKKLIVRIHEYNQNLSHVQIKSIEKTSDFFNYCSLLLDQLLYLDQDPLQDE